MADPGLGGNDTSSRVKHATGQNFEQSVPSKHVFGNPDEIANRVGGTLSTLSDTKPSNFRQLGPSAPGGNVNDLKPTSRSGNQKYGNPRSHA